MDPRTTLVREVARVFRDHGITAALTKLPTAPLLVAPDSDPCWAQPAPLAAGSVANPGAVLVFERGPGGHAGFAKCQDTRISVFGTAISAMP